MATKRQRGKRWEYTVKRKAMLDKPLTLFFVTQEEGDAYCTQLEAQLDAGVLPPEIAERSAAAVEKIATLAQGIRRYQLGTHVAESDMLLLDSLADQIGKDRFDAIDYPWAEAWIIDMKRVRVLSPTTIRHYVGALARCFDWHLRRKSLDNNPLRILPRKYSIYTESDRKAVENRGGEAPYDEQRNRRIEEGEEPRIRAILAGARPEGKQRPLMLEDRESLIMLFEMAIESAMRMREMYTLTMDQINLSRRTIYLDRTKNGDSRQVPMSSTLVERLTAYLHLIGDDPFGGGRLFPWWNGDLADVVLRRVTSRLSGQFGRIFEAAGCPELTFHDLRHEATCRLFERTKMPEMLIAKITGHSSPKLLMRYLSLRGSDLAQHMW